MSRLGPPVAAVMPLHQEATYKTVLRYHPDMGFEISRFTRRGSKTQAFKINPEELQGLIQHWPEWRDWLLNAGVENVAPEIPFQSVSTASLGQDNSPSSPGQGPLL